MERTASDHERSRALVEDAESALERGDRGAAFRALDEAFRADPTNDELALMSAMMRLEDGHPAQAADLALRTIDVRPFHPAAMNVLGVACLDSGRPDLACSVLERTVRMVPGLESARHNLELARLAASDGKATPKDGEGIDAERVRTVLAGRTPTLGASILLRDGDEPELTRCIASLQGWVSEIVVVDARDDVAPSRPDVPADVKVCHPDPSSPRAEQRNLGMQQLGSDWILLLDADESVCAGAEAPIRAAMAQQDTLGHLVVLASPGGVDARRAVRLVRNASCLRYRAGFDDDLVPSLIGWQHTWCLGLGAVPVTVTRPGVEPMLELARDTSDALDDALSDDVMSGFALTRQAALLLHEGQPSESLECAQSARKRLEALPGPRRAIEMQETVLLEGRSLMRLERFDELRELIENHHSRFPATAGSLFLEGLAAKAVGDSHRAAEVLRAALERQDEPGFAEPIPEIVGPKLPNLLGATLLDTGDLESAAEGFRMALDRDPDNLDARLGLIGIEHAEGRIETMLRELDALVEPHGNDPKVWLAGAIVLSRVPALGPTAVAWLDEARKRFPDHAEITRRLAEAQLQCGGAEEALRTLANLPSDEPSRLTAARIAGALACGGELPTVSPGEAVGVADEVLEWFRRWAVFGAVASLDRALMDIGRADRQLPGLGGRTAEWLDRIGQQEAAAGVRSRI